MSIWLLTLVGIGTAAVVLITRGMAKDAPDEPERLGARAPD
jgi:hypothetical protein